MTSPAVTIIVPGFDVAAWAQEALDSLRAQSRADWTAVLVDDGSTDATPALFAAAADADPRFRVVTHARRRGLSAARNSGLATVATPFLGFLDADDRYTPHALAHLLGAVETSGSDFAVGAYVRLRPDAAGGYAAGTVQPWVDASTAPPRRATTIDEHPAASGNVVAWSKVTRTDFWRRAGLHFPEGRLYEDQIVAQQMYTRARCFDTVPEVVVHWRERADGSSITQHTSELPVLREYLAALRGGIQILSASGHAAAVRARVRLIGSMDLPPLIAHATGHPDDAYRRELGAFVRDIRDLADATEWRDADATGILAAAGMW